MAGENVGLDLASQTGQENIADAITSLLSALGNISGVQGPKGDTGDTGPKGDKGDKGDTGEQGPKGDKGDKGDTGAKGDKGDTGNKGDQGVQGETGNGIVSIEKTSTVGSVDTYTITMTDGTTATFTVTNGSGAVDSVNNKTGNVELGIDDIPQLKNALTAVEIVDTASGAIASFADGSDGVPVRDLKVQMEPIQAGSGDPSPDNVRPIIGRTAVTVTRTGFNQWDEEWALGYWNYKNNGAFVPNNNFFACKNKIKILPNTTYCWKSPAMVRECLFYDQNEDYVSRETPSTSSEVTYFTSPSNACYMTFYYGSTYGTTYNHDISINYPSTDTDYHAGHVQSIEIQLGQTVYGGTLDVTQGVLTVDRALVDMGDLNWVYYSTNPNTARFSASVDGAKTFANDIVANILCSIYKPDTYNQVSGHLVDKAIAIARDAAFYVYDSAYTDAATFKTSVTGQTLAYELATPTTVQLTPQQMTTLLGQNNVWSDADSVSVDYVADTKSYIAKVIADALS